MKLPRLQLTVEQLKDNSYGKLAKELFSFDKKKKKEE